MSGESVMGAKKVAQILDRADTDLNGVSRSMLAADPVSMQESQAVLELLVENLGRVKAAAATSGSAWPAEVRAHLQAFRGKLRRLEILGAAAMSVVHLRSERSALATGGYSVSGMESRRPEGSTVALNF